MISVILLHVKYLAYHHIPAKWLKYPDAAFDVITPDKMSGFLLYQVKVSVTIIE